MSPRLTCAIALTLAAIAACGGSAESDGAEPAAECERSAYELERTRYRCTSTAELQTLDCGEWVTLETCSTPEACSPGPDPGCR